MSFVNKSVELCAAATFEEDARELFGHDAEMVTTRCIDNALQGAIALAKPGDVTVSVDDLKSVCIPGHMTCLNEEKCLDDKECITHLVGNVNSQNVCVASQTSADHYARCSRLALVHYNAEGAMEFYPATQAQIDFAAKSEDERKALVLEEAKVVMRKIRSSKKKLRRSAGF